MSDSTPPREPSPDVVSSLSETDSCPVNSGIKNETLFKFKDKHVTGRISIKFLEFLFQAILSLIVVCAIIVFLFIYHEEVEGLVTACFSTLTFIVGLWFPTPKIQKLKNNYNRCQRNRKKKKKRNSNDYESEEDSDEAMIGGSWDDYDMSMTE